MARPRSTWNNADRDLVTRLSSEGLTPSEISERVGHKTAWAIKTFLRRGWADGRREKSPLPEFVIASQDGMCQAYVADLAKDERGARLALDYFRKVGRPVAVYRRVELTDVD